MPFTRRIAMEFIDKWQIAFGQTYAYLASHEIGPLIATIVILTIFVVWARAEKIANEIKRLL